MICDICIMYLAQVNVSRSEASGSLELRVEPQGPAILHSLSQVTDICWAPLATHKVRTLTVATELSANSWS